VTSAGSRRRDAYGNPQTEKKQKNKTMKNNLIAPLETKTTAAIQIEIRRRKCARLLIPLLARVMLGTPAKTAAQTFATYPAGDDVTPSLGQFQIVLDQAWVKIFDVIIPNSPLGSVLSTKHIKLYHKGVITSPTLTIRIP
jgi:hypothetical protein